MTYLGQKRNSGFSCKSSPIFNGIFFCSLRPEKVAFRHGQEFMFLRIMHVHSLNLLNFVYIVVFCQNSITECQVSNSRTTRISNFLRLLPTMVRDGLRNFPQEKNNKMSSKVASITLMIEFHPTVHVQTKNIAK